VIDAIDAGDRFGIRPPALVAWGLRPRRWPVRRPPEEIPLGAISEGNVLSPAGDDKVRNKDHFKATSLPPDADAIFTATLH